MKCTWHPTRDGFGTVLGPHNGTTGYPDLAYGITLAEARERFGDVTEMGPIPLTIDVDNAD